MIKFIDFKTISFFSLAILIHLGAWMIRLNSSEFNITSLFLGLAILIINISLSLLFIRKGRLIGYILGLVALFVQVIVLIPIIKVGVN